MSLWKVKSVESDGDGSQDSGSVVPPSEKFVEHSRRARNVHWRTVDVSPEVFVQVRNNALVDSAARKSADTLPVESEAAAIVSLCDYNFIMGFKAPEDSPLPDPARPEGLMRQHGFLPLGIAFDSELGEDALYVLVRDRQKPNPAPPYLNHNVWSQLNVLVGQHLRKHLHVILLGSGGRVLERAVDFFYYQVEIQQQDIHNTSSAAEPLSVDVQPEDPRQIAQARGWLRNAIDRRASDVHIEPGEGAGRLRLRIDGELIRVQDRIPLGDLVQVITWIKAQARMDIAERRRPQDGGLRLSYSQGSDRRLVDVRVSTIPTIHGQKMVMRLLDPETLRELASQGLHKTIIDPGLHDRFVSALSSRDGVVLVTGPTGSGKTTTLNAALFQTLNLYGDRRNIVTVEDPVEYNVPGVNQIQVNVQAGLTFASALRSILRQDPDIVLVGEIRDPDTASVAIQAALTGHLILATLHTNAALGAVERLQDLGGSSFLIASTVRIFQAQRLIRTLCPNCGTRKPIDSDSLHRKVAAGRLAPYIERIITASGPVFEAAGCGRCENTGFSGRVAVMEMAASSPALISAIERRVPALELVRVAKGDGYRPMVENGIDLLLAGRTSLDEIEAIGLNVSSEGKESARGEF